jgi:general secretion pathway protein A
MSVYLDHFGLKNEPFSKEIDDSKLWLPDSKRCVVDELVTCVHERKHAVVTGEPGVGKTCVLRALRHALGSDQAFRLTYCHNVTLGRRDFYRHVCHALNIPYGSSAGDVFLSLSKHIEELARERAFPVLLVDEAHLIHQDTLDHLHILLNYAWDSKALLSLVLIGLPDLNERLLMRRNRSLHSRLTYRLTIEPLSPNDTAEYIRARLATAGVTKELFTSDAIAILHEAASGSLRDIDRVAHNAIRSSARRKRKLVERDVVQAILQADAYASAVP